MRHFLITISAIFFYGLICCSSFANSTLDINSFTQNMTAGTINSKNTASQFITYCTNSLNTKKNNREAYFVRGHLYYFDSKWEMALLDFSKFLEIYPSNCLALYKMSLCNTRLSNYKEAIANISRAIKICPDNSSLYLQRGIIHSHSGNSTKAIHDLSKTLSITNDSFNAFAIRGREYSKIDKHRKALSDFTKGIKLNPNSSYIWYERAKTWISLGDSSKGLNDISKAILLDPHNTRYYHYRGIIHTLLNNKKGAISDFIRSIQENPSNYSAFYEIGNLINNKTEYNFKADEKSVQYALSSAEHKNDWRTLTALSDAFFENNMFRKAIDVQQIALGAVLREGLTKEIKRMTDKLIRYKAYILYDETIF